jgi:hypothetical protein
MTVLLRVLHTLGAVGHWDLHGALDEIIGQMS